MFLPVGTLSERLEKGGKVVPEDTEVAVEGLDASCLVKPTVPDLTGAKGQNQDCTTGQCGSHSHCFFFSLTYCDIAHQHKVFQMSFFSHLSQERS